MCVVLTGFCNGIRAKQLLDEPYTQKTAEAAAGLGVWTDTKRPLKKAGEDVDMS